MADLGSDVTQIADVDITDTVRFPIRKGAVAGWLYASVLQLKAVFGGGVPPGGTTGQVLTKLSGTDGDADWADSAGGGGGGGGSDVVAKARIDWDSGGTATITTDENVASITRISAGLFEVAFSSAVPADCVCLMSGRFGDVAAGAPYMLLTVDHSAGNGVTTTHFRFVAHDGSTPTDPYAAARDNSWVYFEIKDPTVASGGGGGGGGGASEPTTPPVVRGAASAWENSGNVTLDYSAIGVAEGDLAVFITGGGYAPYQPDDWTALEWVPGDGHNAMLGYKVLDAGDVSAGTVDFPYTGSFVQDVSMIVFEVDTWSKITFSKLIPIVITEAVDSVDRRWGGPWQPEGSTLVYGTTTRQSDAPVSDVAYDSQAIDGNGSTSIFHQDAPSGGGMKNFGLNITGRGNVYFLGMVIVEGTA